MISFKNCPCLVDEIDNFIEKYSLSKSTLPKAECLNRPVTVEQIEVEKLVKEHFHKGQDGFTGILPNLKGQIAKCYCKYLLRPYKIKRENFQICFEVHMILIPESDSLHQSRKLLTSFS